jgi:hypothetical protein
LVNQANQEIG